jgi:hypothetical protein
VPTLKLAVTTISDPGDETKSDFRCASFFAGLKFVSLQNSGGVVRSVRSDFIDTAILIGLTLKALDIEASNFPEFSLP